MSEPSNAERTTRRERAKVVERTRLYERATPNERTTTWERAMNVERPLDPPEAWGCEFCNPESVDEDTDIAVCEHQDPNSPCFCTRPEGHDDDEHAFCVAYRHPLKTWS